MLKLDFPSVRVISNEKNLGFGAANNRALDVAAGKYILYLNSDTVLLNNAVKIFYDYFESCSKDSPGDIGAIGANLLDNDKNVIHSHGIFPGFSLSIKQLLKMTFSNFILSIFYLLHIPTRRFVHSDKTDFYIGNVDYITGADLFLLNNQDARFDEDFFLYFEEADLQKRMALNNKTRQLIDGPQILHLCGGSIGNDYSIKRKASLSRIQFELSRIRFLRKHYHNNFLLFISKLLISNIWLNPLLFSKTKKYFHELWAI